MSSNTAYTELETLLLFQALRAEGVSGITPATFNRISEQLKTVPLICDDPRYDVGRLSPDALRQLYLELLKEEAKQELDRQANGDHNLTNGNVSPGSRKRKAPSPNLPTVREAQQHSHLIPQLVSRFYRLYRGAMIHKLQHHERKYAKVKQEIAEIEAGQRDEVLQHNHPVSQAPSLNSSPKSSSTAHPHLAPNDNLLSVPTIVTDQALPQQVGESSPPESSTRPSQAKIDAVINHGPEPQDSSSGHRRASTNTVLPPLSEMAPRSPQSGMSSKIPAPVTQPTQPVSHHGYIQSPPVGHQSPYVPQPSHAHPRPASVTTPPVQQPASRPSSSPRPILPPPKGMQSSPASSGPHISSPVASAPPPSQPTQSYNHQGPSPTHHLAQPRIPSGPSPAVEGSTRGYSGTPLAPQPSPYYQLPTYTDRRTSYPTQHVQQSSPYSSRPPHPGGYTLPSYQTQSQESPKMPPQQQIRPQHTPIAPQRTYPYAPLPHNAPMTGPRPILPQSSHLVSEVVAALATPPRLKAKPLWKSEYPSHIPPTPRPRPDIEPLSPTLENTQSPVRSTRSTRHRQVPQAGNHTQADTASKGKAGKRRANTRDRSPQSVVSSTADESLRTYTRSQSVSTAVGANQLSDDRPSSRSGVKPEPSTPADTIEEADLTAMTSATPAAGIMTRKRRGTVQSQPPPSAKRKRRESPGGSAEDVKHMPPSTPPTSNTVIGTRNFAKISSAVMNDIISHKHASYFAKEVRDRDAPGYGDIVRQPQNLKAIRSAITAGARAIAVASSNVDSPSGTTLTSATTVELEHTIDLIPPKAIINGVQLEKELMRMFANAYLFNPGEDGMALSTKEMFEDVEQKISEWRGTERDAGRETNVEEDEDIKGKRRKI